MAFEIEQTIQSQYAASPRITGLAKAFFSLVDPYPDIQLFYNDVFNLKTAQGWGLDVWGRIVGIGRTVDAADRVDDYFGFDPDTGINPQATPFNEAPFYSPDDNGSNSVTLQDNAYYLLILTKAAANIGTGSLADLNRQINYLFPGRRAGVINAGTMKIRIYIHDWLQEYERQLLLRGDLPPIPAGVGYEILETDAHTFGFCGSGLEPFNQGVFALHGGRPQNATEQPNPYIFGFNYSDLQPFNQGTFYDFDNILGS